MKEFYEYSDEELKNAYLNLNEFQDVHKADIIAEVNSRNLEDEFKKLKIKKAYDSDLLILKIKSAILFVVLLFFLTYMKIQYNKLTGDRISLIWLSPVLAGIYYHFKKKEINKENT